MEEREQELINFMLSIADAGTVVEGDSLTQFIHRFAELYEAAYGLNSKGEVALKNYTWYNSAMHMRIVREMIRRHPIPVIMHKITKRDAYWFERSELRHTHPVHRVGGKWDPKNPRSVMLRNGILKTVQNTYPGCTATMVFQDDRNITLMISPNPEIIKEKTTV